MIEWTEQAIRQLDQAHDYIALSNSEEVATRITLQIVNSVQQLAAFPISGGAGRVPGTRELVISSTPFIAAHTIEKARIVSAVERGRSEIGAEVLLAVSREFCKSLEWLLTGEG